MDSSLNAFSFVVEGTCGPRQKSMKLGPSVYSENGSSPFSWMSWHFIHAPSAPYFCKPSCFGVYTRSYVRPRAWISHIFFSIASRSSGVNGVSRSEEHTSELQSRPHL